VVWTGRAEDGAGPGLKLRLRRPVALALADGGRWLFTANERAGSVSVIDTTRARTVAEVPLGGKISDLVATPDGSRLLAVDQAGGELLILSREGPKLKTAGRVKVAPVPVSVRVSADGRLAIVAALWTRRLGVVDLGAEPGVARSIDVPFAPRQVLLLPGDKKLIAADSFGGRIAVVDLGRGAVDSVRVLAASNMRGLALSADGRRVLVSHQVINPLAQTTRDDIHWGNLATNNVRALLVSQLLDPAADPLRGSEQYHLGDIGHGTGDPAGVAVGVGGRIAVALAGVGEVAVGSQRGDGWRIVPVGRRPTAVLTSPDGLRAYVTNTFDDSVAVVDLCTVRVVATVSLGPQAELSASDRGNLLFHDARLSNEGWISCQSCHTDGHSNGRLADTLGDGTYGTPKRVPSLLGVKDTAPYAWNGSVPDLSSQVQKSVETTMRGKKLSAEQLRDLTAYLETLTPPPARGRLLGNLDEVALRRGSEVFARHACAACHAPPTYTSAKTYDVGLADEAGLKTFNPPSLRGVGQGGPYFHDGRAATLAEVFTRHRHQLKGEPTKQELEDLVEFLSSL
jgi:YVTN family beta-propeller protein